MDLKQIAMLAFRLRFPPPNTNCFRSARDYPFLIILGVAYHKEIYLFYRQIVLSPP